MSVLPSPHPLQVKTLLEVRGWEDAHHRLKPYPDANGEVTGLAGKLMLIPLNGKGEETFRALAAAGSESEPAGGEVFPVFLSPLPSTLVSFRLPLFPSFHCPFFRPMFVLLSFRPSFFPCGPPSVRAALLPFFPFPPSYFPSSPPPPHPIYLPSFLSSFLPSFRPPFLPP
jgi:hypothetical protein